MNDDETQNNNNEIDYGQQSLPLPPPHPPSQELTGRVVRLHFSCHAELPIGSFLRVTGSTLWAPGTSATDPADAAPAVGRTEQGAFPINDQETIGGDTNSSYPSAQALYTSSVEMVTTPEQYPIWKTRKPVVVVVHNHKKQVQHHYYRYLVVSPGAGAAEAGRLGVASDDEVMEVADEDGTDPLAASEAANLVSTANESTGQSTHVMLWEDPYGSLKNASHRKALSSTSLNAAAGTLSTSDYRNLPYRTVDIDVKTGKPVTSESGIAGANSSIQLDRWNSRDDASFEPYMIREAINEENRREINTRLSNITEVSSASGVYDPEGQEDVSMQMSRSASSGGATPITHSSSKRIYFVCFHLPVVVGQDQNTGEWRATWNESILAKTEGTNVETIYEMHWVGTVTTHPPLQTKEDKETVRAILKEMNCIPIFLEADTRQAHYYGFCKQVLWPAFHNIDLLDLSTCGWLSDSTKENVSSDWDQSRLDDWWNCYVQVNAEFSRVMASLTTTGDILWIHDYHLTLLPQQLSALEMKRDGYRSTRKVFFLHIPFPTSQIFRELECGEKLLKGMLHADAIGFHAFDHARHFLNASKRILGLNYENLVGGLIGVNFEGNTVLVSMSNVSIEPRQVDAALKMPNVDILKEDLKKKHGNRMIIGGVDVGQRLSGTSLKFLAYERLLQDYPSWQTGVVMVQRVLLPGSRKTDESVTTQELRFLVKRIQEKFGSATIDYQELQGSAMPLDHRLALWKASDILMETPIREGLNTLPMEYIYARKEPETPGVVIASEFSAISSILNGALRVNPFDIQMTITTIDKALSMDSQEREGRRYRDMEFVTGCPSDKWVTNVLRDLKDVTIHHQRTTGTSGSNSQVSTPIGTPKRSKELVDSTASFLARESSIAFSHLNFKNLKKAYDRTTCRVIVLDFNGTIVLKEPPGKYLKREILGSSGNKPPPEVLEALKVLCQDPKNIVYVVSGDSSENVMDALGHIPGIGLAISNGAKFSPPLEANQTKRKWLTFDLGVDWDSVRRVALPVLSKYTARSNGSHVKLTDFSIGWSYYSCDPEWGSLQAAHLVLELENELRAFDVRFVTLKGIVEIVPRKLNKGLIVKKVLRDTQAQHPEGVDFVLCFGDDISDEKMFTSVFTFISEIGDDTAGKSDTPVRNDDGSLNNPIEVRSGEMVERDPLYSFTVAVGKKESHASMYVNSAQGVANALVLLAKGEIPQGGVPIWGRENASGLFV